MGGVCGKAFLWYLFVAMEKTWSFRFGPALCLCRSLSLTVSSVVFLICPSRLLLLHAERRGRHGLRSPPPVFKDSNHTFVFSQQPNAPQQRPTAADAIAAVNAEDLSTPGMGVPVQEDDDDDDEESTFNALSLVTPQLKRDQIVLLRQQVRSLKVAFNTQFDEVSR